MLQNPFINPNPPFPYPSQTPLADRMCYLRDIREIRRGAYSKEFDRHQDEIKREDPKRKKCLVILYGNEFKLNSLSLMGWFEQ